MIANSFLIGPDGKQYFRLENKLRCGNSPLTTRNVLNANELCVTLQGNYFSTTALLSNIKVEKGSIDIIGNNGKITLLPDNMFTVEIKNKTAFFISPPMKRWQNFEIDADGIAPFFNTYITENHEESEAIRILLRKNNLNSYEKLYKTRLVNGRYTFITLELKKSADFIGTANLECEGNFYNDSSKPQAFFRLFYNP